MGTLNPLNECAAILDEGVPVYKAYDEHVQECDVCRTEILLAEIAGVPPMEMCADGAGLRRLLVENRERHDRVKAH